MTVELYFKLHFQRHFRPLFFNENSVFFLCYQLLFRQYPSTLVPFFFVYPSTYSLPKPQCMMSSKCVLSLGLPQALINSSMNNNPEIFNILTNDYPL